MTAFSVFFILASFCVQNVSAEDQQDEKKNGFRITKDTVLNVGLSLTPEYESNITKASEKTTIDGVKVGTVSDMILHYSPSIRIKLDDMNKTVGFSVFLDYNHYLGLQDKDASKKLSDLDIKSGLIGEFNKKGRAFFDFSNHFSRNASPDGQDLSGRHKNILDNFVLGLGLKNIEDTLLMKVQAGVDFNYYEESKDQSAYKDYNYVSFVGDIFGRWKFLPKTTVFLKAAYRYQDYYESSIRSDSRSMPVNIFAGIMGQITPHLSAKLSAGYSVSISKDIRHDYNANAELVFKYGKNTLLTSGYLRNMRPSPYYQHYSTHRLYLNFKQKMARVLLAKLDFSYSFLEFGPQIIPDAAPGSPVVTIPGGVREDQLLMLNPSLSYNILSWFGLKLSYELEYRTSDYDRLVVETLPDATTRTVHTYYDFIDHKVLLNIALDY